MAKVRKIGEDERGSKVLTSAGFTSLPESQLSQMLQDLRIISHADPLRAPRLAASIARTYKIAEHGAKPRSDALYAQGDTGLPNGMIKSGLNIV